MGYGWQVNNNEKTETKSETIGKKSFEKIRFYILLKYKISRKLRLIFYLKIDFYTFFL